MRLLIHSMFRLLALLALAMATAAPAQAEQPFAITGTGERSATAGGSLDLHKAVIPAVQNAWRAADSKAGGGGKLPVPVQPVSFHAEADKARQTCWWTLQADGARQSTARANRARGPPRI